MQYDHEQVKQILPHRDPMLLIDTVSEIEPGVRVTASLWIDPARDIFRGHFPEEAVLPGVYTIEAMAQATDLVLMTKQEYAGKVPLLLGADKARRSPGYRYSAAHGIDAIKISHKISGLGR